MSFIHGNNSSDIRLVAAVGAMGIQCDASSGTGTRAVRNKETSAINRVWNLSAVSDCGKWNLGELIKWWRDRQFHVKFPDHPFMRVKAAMASSKAMIDAILHHRGISTEMRGDSMIAVAMDSANIRPKRDGWHETDDTRKVSAFLAMGFKVEEIRAAGSRRIFQIDTVSHIGKHHFQPLEVAWNDANFHKLNPQHPFAYVKSAMWNYDYLVNAIRNDKPLVDLSENAGDGGPIAFLHPDCSAETERKILSQFTR